MSNRLSSFFILAGIVLAVLALWYLSYRAVRWDTRRRGLRELERRAWIVATVVLPLFGFALYLFTRIVRRYLTPVSHEAEPGYGSSTEVKARSGYSTMPPEPDPKGESPRQVPMPEPAWGSAPRARSNGKSHDGAQPYETPETIPAAYQPLRMRYVLSVTEGPHVGQHFEIKSFPARIGRGLEAAVALDNDLNVSRKHAEIYEWNGMLRIRDLGSTHGTLINGVAVNDQALSPGDRIMLGNTVLVLRELP